MTAMNLNRAIRGPVTAVPVVAGKGVRIVPDTVNNRFVAEADETVLFESSTASDSFTTSEPIENFEEIKVILKGSDVSGVDIKSISNVIVTSSYSSSIGFTFLSTYGLSGNVVLNWAAYYNRSSNTFTKASCLYEGASGGAQSAGTNNNVGGVYKVIGINRISST